MQQTTQPISLISINPSLTPIISLTHKLKLKTQIQNPKISAKWGKKRRTKSKLRSQRSQKFIINSIAYIATTFKILPEPFDSLVREFWVSGGGNGGKLGFRNGFGGGGGGGGGKGEKLGFWVILLVSSSLAIWVIWEKEKEIDLGFWGFLIFVCVIVGFYLFKGGWKKGIKDWVLGFSCGVALMGLSLRKNEDFMRWVDRIRANFSSFSTVSKKKRRINRWL